VTRTLVLVDGTNVARSGAWQQARPDVGAADRFARLQDAVASWSAGAGHETLLVFDGVLVERRSPAMTVVGSGDRSADDVLEGAAADAWRQGRTVWVVSSDRAVQDVAGARAERVIRVDEFVGMLTTEHPATGRLEGEPIPPRSVLGAFASDDVRSQLERMRRGLPPS